MKLDSNTFEEILSTIGRNKTRSVLTAFGVFWGLFMLVFLLGGGHGMKSLIVQNMQGIVANSAFVASNNTSVPYKGFQRGRWWNLELSDMELIRSVEGVEDVAAYNAVWNKDAVRENRKYESGTVKGTGPANQKIDVMSIAYGRNINEMDIREARKVCVLGKFVYERLFDEGEDPCGKHVQVDGISYLVVGVTLDESNLAIQGWTPQCVFIPLSTLQHLYNFGNNVDVIGFTLKPGVKGKDVLPKVERIIKEKHLVAPEDKQAVIKVDTEALFSMVDNLMTGFDLLVWMIGIGTLLAGAIGVSNIMMITVKERTTEIGIRRAIGAKPGDILQQIISESIVLTGVAGMAGINFAVLLLHLMEQGTGGYPFQVSFYAATGACGILLVLSVLAGLAPAYRAMAIKPIDAIRDE